MTEVKTVILVAWDNETEHSLSDSDKQRLDDNNIEIVYTGIGKINATRAITDLCVRHEFERKTIRGPETGYAGVYQELHIVNVGCAGSHTTGVRTLIQPNAFIQRDMDARQFNYEQYRTPEQKGWCFVLPVWSVLTGETRTQTPKLLLGGDIDPSKWVFCATGDNANGYSETSEEVPAFDAVDMEAYAFAHVCAYYGVKFTCYKWITDLAAEDSTIEELIENNKLLPWTQIIDEIISQMN